MPWAARIPCVPAHGIGTSVSPVAASPSCAAAPPALTPDARQRTRSTRATRAIHLYALCRRLMQAWTRVPVRHMHWLISCAHNDRVAVMLVPLRTGQAVTPSTCKTPPTPAHHSLCAPRDREVNAMCSSLRTATSHGATARVLISDRSRGPNAPLGTCVLPATAATTRVQTGRVHARVRAPDERRASIVGYAQLGAIYP